MLIYKATNKNTGKSYIGQTIKPLNHRISEHKHHALQKNDNTKFYNSIRKHGFDTFEWIVLEESQYWSKDELDEKEKYYIKLYDSVNNGYNTLEGGQCSTLDGEKIAISCGSKPFYAFNIKGEFLGEFINKKAFAREYNIADQRVVEMVQNKILSANGIIVIDKENYSLELLQYRLKNCIKKLPFIAINKNTKEKSKVFTSIEECKRELNLPKNCHIGEVLKGQRNSSNGYIFKYMEGEY